MVIFMNKILQHGIGLDFLVDHEHLVLKCAKVTLLKTLVIEGQVITRILLLILNNFGLISDHLIADHFFD